MNILSPEAVTQLWDDHSTALVLYARQWCDGPEDIVQEAFLLLVRQVVAPDNSVGWLYRVVRNRAINAARSRGRRSRRETAAAMRGEPWFDAADGDRLDAAAAADALRHLPIEQREAITSSWGSAWQVFLAWFRTPVIQVTLFACRTRVFSDRSCLLVTARDVIL